MVNWWILGAGFPIDTETTEDVDNGHSKEHWSDCGGSSPDFSRGFSQHLASRHLKICLALLMYYYVVPSLELGQLFSFQSFRWASDQAKLHPNWGPDLCKSRRCAHSPIGVPSNVHCQHPPRSPVPIGKPAPKFGWNSPMIHLFL